MQLFQFCIKTLQEKQLIYMNASAKWMRRENSKPDKNNEETTMIM